MSDDEEDDDVNDDTCVMWNTVWNRAPMVEPQWFLLPVDIYSMNTLCAW